MSESVWPFRCAWCDAQAFRRVAEINRAQAAGLNLYCNRECAGFGRRDTRTVAERRAAKADYDTAYREKNRDRLKAEKAAYYAANFDREKERAQRQVRMPKHVEYCRRPEYRKWKADYDKKHRACKQFGPFGEAAIILNQLEAEITSRATWVEIRRANGTLNKHQERRREYDRQTQRS